MHERTRRLICRGTFVAVCLVPTLGTGAFVLWHASGVSRADLQQHLSLLTRASVHVQRVHYPRPGLVRLQRIVFADREHEAELLTLDDLEIVQSDNAIHLRTENASFTTAGWDLCWQRLLDGLQARDSQVLELACKTAQWNDGVAVRELNQLHLKLEPTQRGRQATLDALTIKGERIRIRMLRDCSGPVPLDRWEIDTGDGVLPCSLLAQRFPISQRLGKKAHFRGSLRYQVAGTTSQGQLVGELMDVGLGTLLGEDFPYHWTGEARIAVHSAHFANGRLSDAMVSVLSGPGEIERGLVVRAHDLLQMTSATRLETLNPIEKYERFGLAAHIGAEGIVLRGIGDPTAPGALLTSRWGTVLQLAEPRHPTQPLAQLLHLAGGESRFVAPISPSSDALARKLPMPEAPIRQAQR